MSRTFLKQSSQIAKSDLYQDNLQTGLPLQENAVTIQDDLNALRSMVKAATGASDWYAQPAESISGLNSRLSTAEGDINALESELAAETTRAQIAESGLADDIAAETTRAQNAESGLADDIAAETTRAQNAESGLADDIAAETTRAQNAESGLANDIDGLSSNKLNRDGTQAMTGALNMGTFGIGNLATPVSSSDAATKGYVDSVAVGLTLKAPAKAASPLVQGALPTAGSPVDGVTLVSGDRAFFFEPNGSSIQAGIWELVETSVNNVSTYAWSRPSDYATGSDVSSSFFFVQQGAVYGDTSWVEVSDPAVVGTDALSFSQMFGPGAYLAGAGLDLVGNVFSVGQGEIVSSMIGDGEVSTSKLASGSVETAKIADGAVTNSKLADGAVDNSKISLNTITEDRLAFSVYTEAEVDAALALKLSRNGSLPMTGALNMNYNQINLLAEPTAGADAATKSYVDSTVASIDARASKTYSVVQVNQSAGTALFGGVNAPLDNVLPVMPPEPATFSSLFDVYLNGQLLRPGILVNNQINDMDVNRDAINNQALVLTFDAKAGDVFCVVQYT